MIIPNIQNVILGQSISWQRDKSFVILCYYWLQWTTIVEFKRQQWRREELIINKITSRSYNITTLQWCATWRLRFKVNLTMDSYKLARKLDYSRSYKMNQQTCRESGCYVGWMRGKLMYNNSLSPNINLYESVGKCNELFIYIIVLF